MISLAVPTDGVQRPDVVVPYIGDREQQRKKPPFSEERGDEKSEEERDKRDPRSTRVGKHTPEKGESRVDLHVSSREAGDTRSEPPTGQVLLALEAPHTLH